uniref:Uncharacterized protein n=1 Tax=Pavo cristatus TaxID=9049 RepID=A0A8C9L349_PAVCR
REAASICLHRPRWGSGRAMPARGVSTPCPVGVRGTGKVCKHTSTTHKRPAACPHCLIRSDKYVQEEGHKPKELWNAQIPLKLINSARGTVVDWNHVQDILGCILKTEMKIQPEDCTALMSVPPPCPSADKKYTDVLGAFHLPAIRLAYLNHTSLHTTEKPQLLQWAAAVVLCTWFPSTKVMVHAASLGEQMMLPWTSHIISLSMWVWERSQNTIHLQLDLKEKCCYTSLDLMRDLYLLLKEQHIDYQLLDDGCLITVGKGRFLCAGALFKPFLFGPQQPRLLQLALGCLRNCDKGILRNVVGEYPATWGRTEQDVPEGQYQCSAAPQRRPAVWIGGSILPHSAFQVLWVYTVLPAFLGTAASRTCLTNRLSSN